MAFGDNKKRRKTAAIMKSGNTAPKIIPEKFSRFFWDVESDKLSPEHMTFIAERLLVFGDLEAVRWLRSAMPIEQFRGVVRSSRRFDAKTRQFWEVVLVNEESAT